MRLSFAILCVCVLFAGCAGSVKRYQLLDSNAVLRASAAPEECKKLRVSTGESDETGVLRDSVEAQCREDFPIPEGWRASVTYLPNTPVQFAMFTDPSEPNAEGVSTSRLACYKCQRELSECWEPARRIFGRLIAPDPQQSPDSI